MDLLSGHHYNQYDPDKNAGSNPFLPKGGMRAGLLVDTFRPTATKATVIQKPDRYDRCEKIKETVITRTAIII